MEILRDSFLRLPLFALILSGALCGYLSVFVVLRRTVFLGAALAEVSSAGIAAAILLGVNPLIGSLVFVMVGIGALSVRLGRQSIPQEATVGVGYALAGALAILLIHFGPGETHMLNILTGNILGIDLATLWIAAGVFAGIAVVHKLGFKELLFVSFDPETAASQGYHVRLWDGLLFLTIGIAVAISLRLVGTMVTFAYLVVPGATVLALAGSIRSALIFAPVFAGVLAVVGYYASYRLDLPTGATVTALMVALMCVLLIAGKVRVRS